VVVADPPGRVAGIDRAIEPDLSDALAALVVEHAASATAVAIVAADEDVVVEPGRLRTRRSGYDR
jgi:hypothetical protein